MGLTRLDDDVRGNGKRVKIEENIGVFTKKIA
jgi:hypothetical protein